MHINNEMNLRKFVVPEIVFGSGARYLAGRYAKNLGAHRVLVVSDSGVMAAGWTRDVTTSLEDVGIPYTLFTNVTPNPRVEEVMTGAEVYLTKNCNVIIAVGGGSPMDCAKGIGIVNTNQKHIFKFKGVDQVFAPIPPLVCIPTTAGTSADLSQLALITDLQQQDKFAIVSKTVVPDVSLIDPLTTTSMSAYLTACTGYDALSHAIEAFVSNAHSPVTDLHALEAIRIISQYLIPAIQTPDNLELRSQIMLASMNAGMAFTNAILGAVHAMAHSLGGFLDLAHGECIALLLEHVVAFNFSAVPERYLRIGEAMYIDLSGMSLEDQKLAIVGKLKWFRQTIGLNRSLRHFGIHNGNIPYLAGNAMKDPCMVTNPRRPSQQDIEVIYEKAL